MSNGCFGYHAEDKYFLRQLYEYQDKSAESDKRATAVHYLTEAKIAELPLYYKTLAGEVSRWTNIDDAWGEIPQTELIAMARVLITGDDAELGKMLREAIKKVCRKQAENEID